MTYAEKLRLPAWQKKRLEIMQRDNFHCTDCGEDQVTLNVHHKKYITGRAPWEYDNENFETLCERCHQRRHIKRDAEPIHISSIIPSNLPPSELLLKIRAKVYENTAGENLISQEQLRKAWLGYISNLSQCAKKIELETYALCKMDFVSENRFVVFVNSVNDRLVFEKDNRNFLEYLREYFNMNISFSVIIGGI